MAKWILKRIGADFTGLSEKHGVSPLFIRLLVNRGITDDAGIEAYIHGDDSVFHDPFLLKDMDGAVKFITDKISSGKKIRIVGDYDVDGVCASAVLKKGLDLAGGDVDTRIPHRINDGYGLNENIIDEAHNDGIDTIITCDNGISAVNEIEKAKQYGMSVVITDHHEVPFTEVDGKKIYTMPPADFVVDPKREDDTYPYQGICGAYVAFKFIKGLLYGPYTETLTNYEEIKSRRDNLMSELTELAGLATVADIMELTGENRELVKKGLALMADSKNTGLKALINKTGIKEKKLSAYHCGFILGPCINASGRVDTAERALDLLLCNDENEASVMATELSELNESRKTMTQNAIKEAVKYIEENNMTSDKVLVVYIPDCHESVAGIVAGKIREKYSRPVFVVTDGAEGVKGSARSVESYNIYDEMTKISDIFTKYGGHSQAAGFSMASPDDVERLRTRLNENCTLSFDELRDIMYIDADAPFAYCTPKLLDELEYMQPTGHGNKSCTFARKDVEILSKKVFGKDGIVGKYRVKDTTGETAELTLFNRNEELENLLYDKYGEDTVRNGFAGKGGITFSVAYHPSWNEYNGTRTLQLIIDDFC